MGRIVLALITSLLLFFPLGGAAQSRPTIVATIGMISDVTRELVGDTAKVQTLIQPGVDPHLYKPTRSDVQALLQANLVLRNGLLLEGKMSSAFERLKVAGRKAPALAEEIDPALVLIDSGDPSVSDPHVWMDPLRWKFVARAIAGHLTPLLPRESESIASRLAAYEQRIDTLHNYAEKVFATIPAQQRVLVTAHDAFAYLGARYKLEVIGIQGISTESEASVQQVEEIVALVVNRAVPAIFIESTVSDRTVKAIVAGAAARGHLLSIGGTLYSDAMGPEGSYEGTYIGMLDHNITTIARALGGEAPPRGAFGSLKDPTK